MIGDGLYSKKCGTAGRRHPGDCEDCISFKMGF